MVQSYKNESKSQHREHDRSKERCCDVWYKVTKMRANHNTIALIRVFDPGCDVWYKVTKMRANHNKNLFRCYWAIAVMYGTKLQK